uniref:Putative secreted protein n=1 Tax=Anopheles darlingi TaxID=43151 RepID=A0A2M4CZY0_ANODA
MRRPLITLTFFTLHQLHQLQQLHHDFGVEAAGLFCLYVGHAATRCNDFRLSHPPGRFIPHQPAHRMWWKECSERSLHASQSSTIRSDRSLASDRRKVRR